MRDMERNALRRETSVDYGMPVEEQNGDVEAIQTYIGVRAVNLSHEIVFNLADSFFDTPSLYIIGSNPGRGALW